MPTARIKDQARELVESLPDDATWDDLEYRIHVRRNLELGLKSVEEEDTLSTDELLEHFGLGEA